MATAMEQNETAMVKPNTTMAEQSEVAGKPKEIKAEISIEIIGEDEPTKYDKRRKRWACVARWSLLALAISILSGLPFGLNIYSLAATAISTIAFWIALDGAGSTHPEEPGYYDTPWGFWL